MPDLTPGIAAAPPRSWRRALRHPLWAAYKSSRAWLRRDPLPPEAGDLRAARGVALGLVLSFAAWATLWLLWLLWRWL